jgi:hypothetical protein
MVANFDKLRSKVAGFALFAIAFIFNHGIKKIHPIVNQFNACPHFALLEFFIEFCRILREFRLLVHNLQAKYAKLSKKAVARSVQRRWATLN